VHAFDVIPGMAPVALGLEVSEIKRVFKTGFNARDTARDLARHEGLASDRTFVIEKDAV
jgi:hypothetical protein